MNDDQRKGVAVSTVTQILRRLGSEVSVTPGGDMVTRAEALANYLWDLAINKEVLLPSGEVVKASNAQWLDIVFKLVERMDGKPIQQLSADENTGLLLVRAPRLLQRDVDTFNTNMQEVIGFRAQDTLEGNEVQA